MSSGVDAMDEALRGGMPCGAITELIGPECSGRTSMALAYMAAVTQGESVGAWIDVADALDPKTAAANGVELEHLLWVRCGTGTQAATRVNTEAQQPVSNRIAGAETVPRHTGGGSPHPRSEARDMPDAIGALLRAHGGLCDHQNRRERRAIGTPGASNRPLTYRSEQREEQVNSDRMPPRRGENLVPTALAPVSLVPVSPVPVSLAPRCAEPQPRRTAALHSARYQPMNTGSAPGRLAGPASNARPWQALDQALRAADLLLQSGGFRMIVLDLGSTAPEAAWRIPLATWFRFRAACERTRTSLVLLTQHPCARSSAELVVRLETGSMDADQRVLTGVRYRAEVERSRVAAEWGAGARVVTMRKPPQAERPGQWRSRAAWAQG
jgi:recombination protein RecA